MSYHRLPAFTPPAELIGFGNGSMAAPAETAYQAILAALQEIVRNYDRIDMSHVEFRVSAYQIASATIAKIAGDFSDRQRRDGKPPCGECRLQSGETCDICGAVAERTFQGIPASELARTGVLGWHPGDEA